MINWKVRIQSKTFWTALIPALAVLAQTVLALFGIKWDGGTLSNMLLSVINALFVVLAIIGIVADPTTEGIKDSSQAMTYTEPKKD